MKGDNIMLNKEKYAKEIIDISCDGYGVAKQNGHLQPCRYTACSKCDFNITLCCTEEIRKWANSEYKEPEIDWNKVPVDTPIYVWDNDNGATYKRYFAGYNKVNNMIIAFDDGGTSWSSVTTTKWDNAKIKEGIDCSEWYKD